MRLIILFICFLSFYKLTAANYQNNEDKIFFAEVEKSIEDLKNIIVAVDSTSFETGEEKNQFVVKIIEKMKMTKNLSQMFFSYMQRKSFFKEQADELIAISRILSILEEIKSSLDSSNIDRLKIEVDSLKKLIMPIRPLKTYPKSSPSRSKYKIKRSYQSL